MFAFGMPGPCELAITLAVVALPFVVVVGLVIWAICRITRR